MGAYSIQEETLASLANETRKQFGIFNSVTLSNIIDKLEDYDYICQSENIDIGNDHSTWIRPNDWPDLDSLNLQFEGDQAFVYMTFDANKEGSIISWTCSTYSGQWTIDIGHIENGEYIVDETSNLNSNETYVRQTDDLNGYLVLRITGDLRLIYTLSITVANLRTQSARQQPILERVAYLPKVVTLGTYAIANGVWTTYSLEREVLNNGTGEYLKDLRGAYKSAYLLKEVDLSGLKTQNVTGMDDMFNGCIKLNNLPISNFDFSNCGSLNNIFVNCRNLIGEINLEIYSPNLRFCIGIFDNCCSLTGITIKFIEIRPKIEALACAFRGCYSVKDIKIKNIDVSKLSSLGYLCLNCTSLKSITIDSIGHSSPCVMKQTFMGCISLIDLNINFEYILASGMESTFSNCNTLRSIDLSKIKVDSSCTTIDSCFNNCHNIRELNIPTDWDLTGLNSIYTVRNLFNSCRSLRKITGIKNWDFSSVNGILLSSMFAGCNKLKELDISNWNVSTIDNASSMFSACYCLTELDLSNWDLRHCANLASTFQNCYSLKKLKLPTTFTPSDKLTNLGSTFSGCMSLEELNLSNWDVSNCTTFEALFNNCRSLKTIGDISSWSTSNVTKMNSMFSGCMSLEEFPDISSWNLSNVTSTNSMFAYMYRIKEVFLPNLNLPKVTSITSMFFSMYKLENMNVSGWNTPLLNTAPGTFIASCYSLKNIIPPTNINLNNDYTADYSLTYESLLRILNSLPTVSTARTLKITADHLNRLTPSDKAIATQKGWTVAA